MLSSTLILALLAFTCLWLSACAQSTSGANYFRGGGAPGAAAYELIDDYQPSNFFSKFSFYSSYDPTYGHVQYVNSSVAVRNGFVSITKNNTARIQPDLTNLWPNGGPGRPSVRITSDNTYLHGLFVLDINHVPWGCGTWPAYWLLGPDWPKTGEIDIIEGVNTLTYNTVSLHTSGNCTIAGSGQTATFSNSNCNAYANGNSGCGSLMNSVNSPPNNYGPGLNAISGGVYATEWTSEYIQTWWFPRGSIPSSITAGSPNISQFGEPAVNMQGSCDIDSHFQDMSVIFNIDFCGAYAGNVYRRDLQCPQNASAPNSLNACVDFVGSNPHNLTEAYFDINYLRVFQMPSQAVPTSSYSTSLSSVVPQPTTNTVPKGEQTSLPTTSSKPYSGPVASSTLTTALPTATATSCPGLNDTQYTDANGHHYNVYCGFDYVSPSPVIQHTSSFELCMELCDATAGCNGVAYTGTVCYTKVDGYYLASNAHVDTALRVAGPVVSSLVSSSTIRVSQTRSSSVSLTAGTSKVSSSSTGLSTASSGTPSPSSSALPQSSASCPANNGAHVRDECGVTYVLSCGNDTSYGSQAGIQAPSFHACFALCSSGAHGACSAFTFDTAAGFCYLKSHANEAFVSPAARLISAVQLQFYGNNTPSPVSTSRSCAATTT